MNSKFIYGVSMHDGISKVLSLKLDTRDNKDAQVQTKPAETQTSVVVEENKQM